MFAMMNFLSVEQGSRPSRPVVIRPAGDGLAASLAGTTQWSTWKRKQFVPRGMRAAQGKLFSLEVAAIEARPPPGFTNRQDALGRPAPKGNMADSAPRVTASSACALTRARTTPSDKVKASLT